MPLDFPNPSGKDWKREKTENERKVEAYEAQKLRAEELTMSDPYERAEDEITLVLIERVVRRRVPDYEAEVLLRNGWRVVTE